VVNLVADRFANIYHAQIFLLDDEGRYAVLRASTGEAGEKLLARGHRLEVGSRSVIGQVTSLGQVVVARDIGTSDIHRRNEFLPNTRAELAVPLRVGDRVIGALDVQSYQSDTFTADQTRVLQIMADQIAVAIENARLYQQTQRRASDEERRQRALTRHAWRQYLYDQRAANLESVSGQASNLADLDSLRQAAAARGEAVVGTPTEHHTICFAVPIRLRGETLGAVAWEVTEIGFDRNKVLLAQELTDRLAISLENARLFTQSQRAAERERLVNEIGTRLTGQTDIDRILRTAVREVGQALRVPQVSVHLHTPGSALTDGAASGGSSNGGSNGSGNGSTNGHSEAS
jgi:GAF domain-containing protein